MTLCSAVSVVLAVCVNNRFALELREHQAQLGSQKTKEKHFGKCVCSKLEFYFITNGKFMYNLNRKCNVRFKVFSLKCDFTLVRSWKLRCTTCHNGK
jgi:rRNA maturation endonuclease Nob1